MQKSAAPKMLLAVVVFCVAGTSLSLGQKVHEQMSVKQVAEIFQTTHDSVPKYDVVQFHVPRLNKRALGQLEALKTTVFGKDVKLWLKPREGVLAGRNTPVFIAKMDPSRQKVMYNEIPGAMRKLGSILEDPAKKTTLLARTDARGQYSFNGFIGSENLIVRSLPESISANLVRNSSSHNLESSGNSKSAYHVIFKREVKDSDTPFYHSKLAEKRIASHEPRASRSLPRLPKVVYPECMVVVDYSLFKMYDSNIDKVLMYILAFWNGVDLLYRSFDEPKFRLNIARIVIAGEEKATPYLSDNMQSSNKIVADTAHAAAQRYFYSVKNIFPTSSYDAITIMTSIQMTNPTGNIAVVGIAEPSGACVVDDYNKRVKSVQITQDDGTFQGVSTAAHEFGHLLGAEHDNVGNCKVPEGYIMAGGADITDYSHDFSKCSVTAIEHFLRENGGSCFYNEPRDTDSLPRGYLPGVFSSRDDQCKKLGRGSSCYDETKGHNPCSSIYCFDKKDQQTCWSVHSRAPPEGAFCRTGKVCLHGQCVSL